MLLSRDTVVVCVSSSFLLNYVSEYKRLSRKIPLDSSEMKRPSLHFVFADLGKNSTWYSCWKHGTSELSAGY